MSSRTLAVAASKVAGFHSRIASACVLVQVGEPERFFTAWEDEIRPRRAV
jgi:hypothetical protein